MKGADPVVEKCPVLLREDLGYALKQLLSIIKDDDYEDLGNHVGGHPLSFVPSNCCLILTSIFESCRGSS